MLLRSILRNTLTLLWSAAILCAAGCTLSYKNYSDARSPGEQTATLSVDRRIHVLAIDGKDTGFTGYLPLQNGMDLELTPGAHVLVIQYRSTQVAVAGSTMTQTATTGERIETNFVFERGRRYEIHYGVDSKNQRFGFMIIDVTTSGSRKSRLATWGETSW